MAVWDSADLLAKFRTEIRQTAATDFPLDADGYMLLSVAQSVVLGQLSIVVPDSQYGAPFALTTADGGFTFTFGVDADGANIFPLGEFELYRTLNAVADSGMQPFTEFLVEGDRIRIPGNLAYQGPGVAPFCRMLTPSLSISAAAQPVVKPKQARQAIVYEAARHYFAITGNSGQRDEMQGNFDREFDTWMVAMRDQADGMEAQAGTGAMGGSLWYTGIGASSRWW